MIQKVVTIKPQLTADAEGMYTHAAGISMEDVNSSTTEEESITVDQSTFETFLGVYIPVSEIEKYIIDTLDTYSNSKEDIPFPTWSFINGIMKILKEKGISIEDDHKLENLRALISSNIRLYTKLNVLQDESALAIQIAERNINEIFSMEERYRKSNLSFYADLICLSQGREIWPIVNTNEEGFHYCIGLVMREKQKYIAIPFIKEVPHFSTLKIIEEAVENTHDSMIHNYPTELWNSLGQRNGMSSNVNELPINNLTVRYLSISKIGEFIQNVSEGNYDLSEMNGYLGPAPFIINLAKSMFITKEMDIAKVSYADMYKIIEYRTLNLTPEVAELEKKVSANASLEKKYYNDINAAMLDIVNINEIGLKKTQNEETKNFLSDFLSF